MYLLVLIIVLMIKMFCVEFNKQYVDRLQSIYSNKHTLEKNLTIEGKIWIIMLYFMFKRSKGTVSIFYVLHRLLFFVLRIKNEGRETTMMDEKRGVYQKKIVLF